MSEFFKVGDTIRIVTVPVDVPGSGGKEQAVPEPKIITAIWDAKTNPKVILDSLSEKETVVSGSNLLDDPRHQGKVDPGRIYVIES